MKTYGKIKIFETLKEIVDPEHTALVVWDVQNALFDRIFNKQEFITNLQRLIGEAHKVNVPVIYSKVVVMPDQFDSSWRFYIQMKRFGVTDPSKLQAWLPEQSPLAEIPPEVYPKTGDLIVKKYTASLFIDTPVESFLKNRQIKTVLFSGLFTEAGVDSSARESSNRGYYTIVIEDCVSSIDKEMHELTLKLLKKVFLVLVHSSQEVINSWK